jgi:hypothetical protein
MARPFRIEYPGAVYNITSRGNLRECLHFGGANIIMKNKILRK